MKRAYYNEIEPYAARWLRNLMAAGLIPEGEVDERSITDVRPADLDGFGQCHFFAGIGGWGLALRLAGIPDDAEVWTGSCPCQPLSVAGQRKGHADERHLWPAFYSLIAERHPAVIFGEQVASKDGREWLAGVRADLEELGYACGAANLPACGVGAPHRRERLWFVADTHGGRRGQAGCNAAGDGGQEGSGQASGDSGRGQAGFWDDAIWLTGADGQSRRVGPGLRLLAHGIPARVAKLRAYGNAIVPQVAAQFIAAALEAA